MWEAAIAAVAAVFGGVGLKLVESWAGAGKNRTDVATQIRDELRTEVAEVRKDIRDVEDRLDRSREMYYAVLHAFNLAKSKLIGHGFEEDARELDRFLRNRTDGHDEPDE